MMSLEDERQLREILGAAVLHRSDELGGGIHRTELAELELPDRTRQRMLDPGGGGIWNPRSFNATLSIVTSPTGPYADQETAGTLTYKYQRGDTEGKNAKLRRASELDLPVIRFHKVATNYYLPIFPVFVIGVNPIAREFVLTIDDALRALPSDQPLSPIEKRYSEQLVKVRVHQRAFRARVMLAYDRQCTICSFRHVELLDAAHILEDSSEAGAPDISNGLSLCRMHHAAFDRNLLGISADYVVHINKALLEEVDGPMLRYGLQEMHGRNLSLPARTVDYPSPENLDERYRRFAS